MRAVALVCVALGLGACAPSSRTQPNVLLVTIDTLRADRLSSYGHTRETTPFLDAFAARAVRFERAYTATSWTAPAVVSLLTSLPPMVHGVEHGFLQSGEIVQQEVIPERAVLWAELLSGLGHRTYGVTANGHLDPRFGFGRGFDRYRCLGFVRAGRVEAAVSEWRDEILESGPWFVWVHFFDPHAPYAFHSEVTQASGPNGRRLRRLENTPVPQTLTELGVEKGNSRFDYVNALYDGEIRHTDAAIERIFEMLRVSADDLVIVTADHGEELLDHGRFGHGVTLYEEVMRVPLIVQLPGGQHAGSVESGPVSTLDLLPTVLDVLGAEPEGLGGSSLVPLLRGSEIEPREIVGSLSRLAPLESKSLTLGSWKYIHHYVSPELRGLYDLSRDPEEQENLIESQSERAAELARRLFAQVERARAARLEAGTATLSPERRAELEALGYLGEEP